MKVNIEYSTGNFTLGIVGEVDTQGIVPAPPLDDIIVKGLRYETERSVASECYRVLAGKNGKLPKGYKRETLQFTVENALKFSDVAESELGKSMPGVRVTCTENVGSVKADALALLSDMESRDTLEVGLAKLGYTGDTHGEDGEFHPAAVSAVSAKLKDIARQTAEFKKGLMAIG